jgi:hypothetical protein
VGKCPGDAGHRNGQDEESKNLLIEGHAVRCLKTILVCNAHCSGFATSPAGTATTGAPT